MTKRFAIFVGLILFAVQSFAQIMEPVKWAFETRKDGENIQLVFKASIDEGWHLYDTSLPDGGPVPTSFYFNDNANVELVGEMKKVPAPTEKFDYTFQMELRYFSNSAEFIQTVKVKGEGEYTFDGYLEFMCCNDETCLPPTEVDFSFKLKGTAAPAEKKKGN